MAADARRTTHPIQHPIADESEAMAAFDDITYIKGQAFIRMLESYLGEDAFRAGIRSYMAAHAYSNATTADLWQALTAASGQEVAAIASAYTEQGGVPLERHPRGQRRHAPARVRVGRVHSRRGPRPGRPRGPRRRDCHAPLARAVPARVEPPMTEVAPALDPGDASDQNGRPAEAAPLPCRTRSLGEHGENRRTGGRRPVSEWADAERRGGAGLSEEDA